MSENKLNLQYNFCKDVVTIDIHRHTSRKLTTVNSLFNEAERKSLKFHTTTYPKKILLYTQNLIVSHFMHAYDEME
ncbi:unnamed protein product [Schistosoma curassoni]|nr:unnamed protein product [Schistosoma curassoni]